MNNNLQDKKPIMSQTSFHLNPSIANKVGKSKLIQKSNERNKSLENKNNKNQNKIKVKQFKMHQNNSSNSQSIKNNAKVHYRTKSNQKQNPRKNNKIVSSRNIKIITTDQHNKNKINTKINILPQPSPLINKMESDLNKYNFINPGNNKLKIDTKNIPEEPINKNDFIYKGTDFDNLSKFPLNDISSLYNAWQYNSVLYKIFEEKLLKKNNFEIDKNTLEIKTKNAESCQDLNDQKFWILYAEYLINNNLLVNEKQFLSVINEAFSYMESDCPQLRTYYLEKIKKFSPCYLSNGTLDESDDTYLDKLNKSVVNFIKREKGINSSNIKLKSTIKIKPQKIVINKENNKNLINYENKHQKNENINEIITENQKASIDEIEFEIIENPDK